MDIVERLGELRLGDKEYGVVVDAIDEIERLRKVLQEIADNDGWSSGKALEQFAKQHLEKGE